MARKIETLLALYMEELRHLYSAESQLAEAMNEMAQSVQSADLRGAFEDEAAEAQKHASKISAIFASVNTDPSGRLSRGMQGLLQEGRELIDRGTQTPVLEAGLIVTAQKAQHYEIACYGSASAFARILGRSSDEKVLQQNMAEEKEADANFSNIANHTINIAAAAAN